MLIILNPDIYEHIIVTFINHTRYIRCKMFLQKLHDADKLDNYIINTILKPDMFENIIITLIKQIIRYVRYNILNCICHNFLNITPSTNLLVLLLNIVSFLLFRVRGTLSWQLCGRYRENLPLKINYSCIGIK